MTKPHQYTPDAFHVRAVDDHTLLIEWPAGENPATHTPWTGKWIVARASGPNTELYIADGASADPVAEASLALVLHSQPLTEVMDYLIALGREWQLRTWLRKQFIHNDVNPSDVASLLTSVHVQARSQSMALTGLVDSWNEAVYEWRMLEKIVSRGITA